MTFLDKEKIERAIKAILGPPLYQKFERPVLPSLLIRKKK